MLTAWQIDEVQGIQEALQGVRKGAGPLPVSGVLAAIPSPKPSSTASISPSLNLRIYSHLRGAFLRYRRLRLPRSSFCYCPEVGRRESSLGDEVTLGRGAANRRPTMPRAGFGGAGWASICWQTLHCFPQPTPPPLFQRTATVGFSLMWAGRTHSEEAELSFCTQKILYFAHSPPLPPPAGNSACAELGALAGAMEGLRTRPLPCGCGHTFCTAG